MGFLKPPLTTSFMIEWTPRVCIEIQNQTDQMYIDTQRKIVQVKIVNFFLKNKLD